MDTENIIKTFDFVAKTYNHSASRFFPFTADRLVGILRPLPGSKILDVATGTGVVAMAMAQAVGQNGRVIGVDLSEAMMAEAENSFKKFGLDNIDLFTMDGAKLDFKNNYFDHVTCSFGLFFMPDMVAALKEWRRVLKPGGKVIFSCFDEGAFSPMADRFAELLMSYGVAKDKLHPASERLKSKHACESVIRDAGFTRHETQSIQVGYHLNSESEWWDLVWSSAFRRLLDQIPEHSIPEFKQRHLETLQSLKDEKGLWLNVPVLVNIMEKN